VIPVTQDQIDEDDETVQLTITLPAVRFGATVGPQSTVALTIADDDPLPALSIAGVSQAEGNSGPSTALFTVTRVGATGRTVTVQYATEDGSAKSGTDYSATRGTLTLAPNESTGTIAVPLLGDTIFEADEVFTVSLSNPTNATLAVSQATGVIKNDDVIVACTPRPRIAQTLTTGDGALNVHVESTPLNAPANNPLQQIRFGVFQNATVSLNGQTITSGQTITIPPGTISVDFVVRRSVAGQPTTVPFTVTDGCGDWTTFVGGGVSSGF
jgi:hypothetical protein